MSTSISEMLSSYHLDRMNNMSKMKVIESDDYDKRHVPPTLRRAVHVLNEALAIDPMLVRNLLDEPTPIMGSVEEKFLGHSSIVVRALPDGSSCLTALGLLAGCVNGSSHHRLAVQEEDDGTWTRFMVMAEEIPDEELPLKERIERALPDEDALP